MYLNQTGTSSQFNGPQKICNEGIARIRIQKILLSQDEKDKQKRPREIKIATSMSGTTKKETNQKITNTMLHRLNIQSRFLCDENSKLKIQIFKTSSNTPYLPFAFVQFPMYKFFQIQDVQHSILLQFIDCQKLSKQQQQIAVAATAEIQITIFRHNIGIFGIRQLMIRYDSQKITEKIYTILMECNGIEVLVSDDMRTVKNQLRWENLKIPIYSIDSTLNIMLIQQGKFKRKEIAKVSFKLKDQRMFLETNQIRMIDTCNSPDNKEVLQFFVLGSLLLGGSNLLGLGL